MPWQASLFRNVLCHTLSKTLVMSSAMISDSPWNLKDLFQLLVRTRIFGDWKLLQFYNTHDKFHRDQIRCLTSRNFRTFDLDVRIEQICYRASMATRVIRWRVWLLEMEVVSSSMTLRHVGKSAGRAFSKNSKYWDHQLKHCSIVSSISTALSTKNSFLKAKPKIRYLYSSFKEGAFSSCAGKAEVAQTGCIFQYDKAPAH